MTEKPLLLLSNDDGFDSKGLKELIETLRPMADLIVVALPVPAPVLREPLRRKCLCAAVWFLRSRG